MVIHHPDCLHEGVADRWPYKLESSFEQVTAHLVGFLCSRLYLGGYGERIDDGLAAHKLPDVRIKAAEFFLHCQKRSRVLYRGTNFQPITDNARVRH